MLRPEPPVDDWLAELDAQVARSPAFLESKPVLVDLGGVTEADADLLGLVRSLQGRGLRILAVEGVDPSWAGAGEWGGAIPGGRSTGMVDLPAAAAPAAQPVPAEPVAVEAVPAGLVIAEPVRSGQTVIYPAGDVTVLGSVASGAEVFAGGSIHVYGTLRGRAVPAFNGNPGARVLPPAGGRTGGDRRLLPHRRRHGRRPARPAGAGLAANGETRCVQCAAALEPRCNGFSSRR